ncbi:hypothetical protein SARC_04166 [Sphaeroforma arctica JP610]|uniref:Uncharacterized protein n=1 Tax=Sphaeroforma arctica JP610 TaxID=667725 RepID=A0A0L0G3A8_9EUKA|nr:hypothetical protein SARC_04166 [Sphaeroforma arctica JP610]KNC83582.1 hypothetical protein SARC_04166 [Sphaeroforma arctica JP610]|eukprot:XP_014157484.1 hypothetical protein SARC_04166 [Sphaeroforma arctica JP610]
MASPALTNLGDGQSEAKEQMLSLYIDQQFCSKIQLNMLSGMQGIHMRLVAMATLYADEWYHLRKDTSHAAVAAFVRALRKDPQVTVHPLQELLIYMASRSLLNFFLDESPRDAQTSAETAAFSANNVGIPERKLFGEECNPSFA